MGLPSLLIFATSVALSACLLQPFEALSASTAHSLPDSCRQTPADGGNCKALFTTFYYDQERNACDEAFYGGCGGFVPFYDLADCQAACEIGEALRMTEFRKVSNAQQARIRITFPKTWDQPVFQVLVNNVAAEYRLQGDDSREQSSMREFLVELGSEATRRLEVTTTINGRTFSAFIPLHWSAD